MNRFIKQWFYILVLLAITPTLLQGFWRFLRHFFTPVPLELETVFLGVVGLVLLVILLLKKGGTLFAWLFSGLFGVIRWLWFGLYTGQNDSRFMSKPKQFWFINPFRKGFVVDGVNRLSPKHSFQNLLAVGGVGTGKTSVIATPSIYQIDHASMVITDVSGELYAKTSQDLVDRGYRLQALNLMELTQGHYFNPLSGLSSHTDIAQAAHIIIHSSKAIRESNDKFWAASATKLVRVLLQAMSDLDKPEYMNLANLKRLLNHFDAHKRPNGVMDRFMIHATLNDSACFEEYKGLLAGNDKTLASFISTADSALASLNPELAQMTAQNEIDFTALRTHKTALFILVRQQNIGYYECLLNLFFTQLINSLLSDLSLAQKGLPVYMLIDEFAQLEIDGFEVFAATARKYRIGFALLIQAVSQLASRYGHDKAQTIIHSLAGQIYFSGQDIDIAAKGTVASQKKSPFFIL